MSKLRHWKQRWDKNAPLVFLKKLRMGDGQVLPGDPVTDEIREKLGLHRLRRWWEAGVIARADQPLPNHIQRAMAPAAEPEVEEPVEETVVSYPVVREGKGSWFEVEVAEGDIRKVNGQKALDELLESLED